MVKLFFVHPKNMRVRLHVKSELKNFINVVLMLSQAQPENHSTVAHLSRSRKKRNIFTFIIYLLFISYSGGFSF